MGFGQFLQPAIVGISSIANCGIQAEVHFETFIRLRWRAVIFGQANGALGQSCIGYQPVV